MCIRDSCKLSCLKTINQSMMRMNRNRHHQLASPKERFSKGNFRNTILKCRMTGMTQRGKTDPGNSRIVDHVWACHPCFQSFASSYPCLLYTSDAADEEDSV